MTFTDPRTLIQDFATDVGMGTVEFSAENSAAFSAGEVALEMRYDLEGPHILIVSPIAKVPRESKSVVFSKLLELNYGATLAASGSVSYDADEELLMYVNYINLTGLESATFGKFVHRSVDAIERWQTIAKASASGTKNKSLSNKISA